MLDCWEDWHCCSRGGPRGWRASEGAANLACQLGLDCSWVRSKRRLDRWKWIASFFFFFK